MATPAGHFLLGLAIAQAAAPGVKKVHLGFLAGIACVPDLDIVPGLLVGDLSRFHHGISHSILAALVFSVGLVFVFHRCWNPPLTAGLLVFSLYCSHLLLDFLSLDTSFPHGVPLLWPLVEDAYQSPWLILPNVLHTRDPLISGHNFSLLIRELLIFLPLNGLVYSFRNSLALRLKVIFAVWFLGALLLSFSQMQL